MKHIPIYNGLDVHLLQTGKFKTNIMTVLLRTELKKETAAKNALLAGILGMGFEGCGSKLLIAKECEQMSGAAFEINVIKKGEEQLIQLYVEVLNDMRAGKSLLEDAGLLLNGVLFKPLSYDGRFNDKYMAIQKERLLQKIKSKINDKKVYALDRCIELMCEGERFSVPCDGYDEELKPLDASAMYSHYENTIRKSPILVGVIGDIEEVRCSNWAESFFKRQGFVPEPYENSVIAGAPKNPKTISEYMGINQGKLVIGLRCGTPPTGKEFCSLLLLNEIIGGGANSRLFKNAREKFSLCYYINSFIYRAKSIMIVQAGIDEADFERTTDVIKEQFSSAADGAFTDDELVLAKHALKNQFEAVNDSPQKVMDFYLSGVLAGDKLTPAETIDEIISLTKDDVTNCAGKISLDTVYFLT